MKRSIVAGAAFAALLVPPALAQSYDPDYGTGNTVPQAYNDVTGPVTGTRALAYASRSSRTHAFAPAPVGANLGIDSPALTGGGNTGYNKQTSCTTDAELQFATDLRG